MLICLLSEEEIHETRLTIRTKYAQCNGTDRIEKFGNLTKVFVKYLIIEGVCLNRHSLSHDLEKTGEIIGNLHTTWPHVTSHYATGGTVVYNDRIAIPVSDDDPVLVPFGVFSDWTTFVAHPTPPMLSGLKLFEHEQHQQELSPHLWSVAHAQSSVVILQNWSNWYRFCEWLG